MGLPHDREEEGTLRSSVAVDLIERWDFRYSKRRRNPRSSEASVRRPIRLRWGSCDFLRCIYFMNIQSQPGFARRARN